MESTGLIIGLIILFVLIGAIGSLVYYFARYYVKTDTNDNELFTKKPVELGLENSLDQKLVKTREALWGRIAKLVFKSGALDSHVRDELEEILYSSDMGPVTTNSLLEIVSEQLSGSQNGNFDTVRTALRAEITQIFNSSQVDSLLFDKKKPAQKLLVWMIVGVNGAGKTTTIGKMASIAQKRGLKTLIIAGDTFRAAADSQLKAWADRAQCEIYSGKNNNLSVSTQSDKALDPSAVIYGGLEKAKSMGVDLVLIDTAGRLHTQDHLMSELVKMKKVMGKLDLNFPHETILVIDANAGQNALVQARQFHEAIKLTGLVITKMDGTSKAGIAVAIANEIKVPIYYIGLGEAIEDLRAFDSKSFIEAIL
jgi:fused signal recognition particle receptor